MKSRQSGDMEVIIKKTPTASQYESPRRDKFEWECFAYLTY